MRVAMRVRPFHFRQLAVEVTPEHRAAQEVAKLIRKLRWIGVETEAERLQQVLSEFPSDKRGRLLAGPHSTD